MPLPRSRSPSAAPSDSADSARSSTSVALPPDNPAAPAAASGGRADDTDLSLLNTGRLSPRRAAFVTAPVDSPGAITLHMSVSAALLAELRALAARFPEAGRLHDIVAAPLGAAPRADAADSPVSPSRPVKRPRSAAPPDWAPPADGAGAAQIDPLGYRRRPGGITQHGLIAVLKCADSLVRAAHLRLTLFHCADIMTFFHPEWAADAGVEAMDLVGQLAVHGRQPLPCVAWVRLRSILCELDADLACATTPLAQVYHPDRWVLWQREPALRAEHIFDLYRSTALGTISWLGKWLRADWTTERIGRMLGPEAWNYTALAGRILQRFRAPVPLQPETTQRAHVMAWTPQAVFPDLAPSPPASADGSSHHCDSCSPAHHGVAARGAGLPSQPGLDSGPPPVTVTLPPPVPDVAPVSLHKCSGLGLDLLISMGATLGLVAEPFPLPYMDFLCTISAISASVRGTAPVDFQAALETLPIDCLARATIVSLATEFNGLHRPPAFHTSRARAQLVHLGLRALAWVARALGVHPEPTATSPPGHVLTELQEAVTIAWRERRLRPPFPAHT